MLVAAAPGPAATGPLELDRLPEELHLQGVSTLRISPIEHAFELFPRVRNAHEADYGVEVLLTLPPGLL